MTPVFVDTAGWLALINKRDSLHQQSRRIMASLERPGLKLVTTEFVLLEVADALCTPQLRATAINFVESARRRSDLQILPLSDELLQVGWEIYRRRPDKAWGLTDCISFAAMTRENLTIAFTSDHHFEQAGFGKLM